LIAPQPTPIPEDQASVFISMATANVNEEIMKTIIEVKEFKIIQRNFL
jgi:hypothetical protein